MGIFPNDASVIRLGGMILTDTNDEWISTNAATYPKAPFHCCAPTGIMA